MATSSNDPVLSRSARSAGPDTEVSSTSPEAASGFDVANSAMSGALTGPVDAFQTASIASVMASHAGFEGIDLLGSNADAQRLLQFTREAQDIPQNMSMTRIKELMAASTGSPLPPAVGDKLDSALGDDLTGVTTETERDEELTADDEAPLEQILEGRDGGVPGGGPAEVVPTMSPAEAAAEVELPTMAAPDEEAGLLGGSGVTTLPAELPAGRPPPQDAGQPRQTDEVVDHYMKVHWDQSDLHAKSNEFGAFPQAIATETDRWLPVMASPEVRSGANFLVGLGSGLMDGFIGAFAKSIPGIGAISELVFGIKDAWAQSADCFANGDTAGGWFEIIRGIFDTVGGVAGNLGDVFTYAQDTAHALAPISAGVSEVVGVPAAAIANGCSAVQSVVHGALVVIDGFILGYHYAAGQEAEANGLFARAEWHRGRATDGLFRTVASIFQAAFAFTSSASGAVVPGQLPGTWAEMLVQSGRKFQTSFGDLIKDSGPETAFAIGKRFEGPGRNVAGLFQGATNLQAAAGFGDVMARTSDGFMGGHFIERQRLQSTGTRATLILNVAREETLERMDAGWAALDGEKPLWHQEAVNTILSPEAGVGMYDMLNVALSPSEWIRVMFAGTRYIASALGDRELGNVAGLAGLAESALTGIAEPFINNVGKWFAEEKPALNALVSELNDKIQQQALSLGAVRAALAEVDRLSAGLGPLADSGGQIDQVFQPMIARLLAMRVSADTLGIPSWVPGISYEWAIRGINSRVDMAVNLVTFLKNGALQELDQGLESAQSWIQENVVYFQEAVAEGGELERMLQDELRNAQEMSQQATDAFTAWDAGFAVDFSGASDWLKQVAAQAQASTQSAMQDRWKKYVETVSQAYVEDWKSRNADHVYDNFTPTVSPGEIAAVEEVYSSVSADLAAIGTPAAEARRTELNKAYQACMAFNGATGREALEGLWAAEERLAQVATQPLPFEQDDGRGVDGRAAP